MIDALATAVMFLAVFVISWLIQAAIDRFTDQE